jgi:type II secretory pathway component PulF
MVKQVQKISKIGILLAGVGIIIGIVDILMLVAVPMFKKAHAGELNVRLSAFTEFVLAISDAVRLHAVVAECVALALLVTGLITVYCARLRLHNS